MLNQLQRLLFPGGIEKTYAIVDGASCEKLLEKLAAFQPEYVCLYAGELEPDVEECAPYLIHLELDSQFTRWLIDEGWGKHWGIFATSPAELRAVRKHLRTFLMVKDPNGRSVYFRYYDPRVLNGYLPTCNVRESRIVFGPVKSYLAERGDSLLSWTIKDGAVVASIPLSEPGLPKRKRIESF